jgi:glycerol-3-phosphate dehydrogenase
VRPLPHRDKGPESAITRRHIIKVHRDAARGLVSIVGGKLTTYRNLAEQTVDRLAKLLRWKLPACRTQDTQLPGAWGVDRAREALDALGLLAPEGVERMLDVYGGRALGICALCEDEPGLARTLGDDRRVLAAEVVFAIREEFATTLEDVVFRRLMIGLDADQGRLLYPAIAELAAAELGWSADDATRQLDALTAYSDSFTVQATG